MEALQNHTPDTNAPANETGAPLRPTEAMIRARVGDRHYERALTYHAWGAVFDARRHGARLTARCEGSGDEVWKVEVTLGADDVAAARCTCPVGAEGDCKHVGALLLAWQHRPGTFAHGPSTEDRLRRLDGGAARDVLLALHRALPEIEGAIEALLPEAPARRAPTPVDAWRLRAAEALREGGDGADALREIVSEGESRTAGRAAARASMYEQVASAALGRAKKMGGEGAAVAEVARACVEGLRALAASLPEGDEARWTALRAMMGLYRFDIEQGVAMRGGVGREAIEAAVSVATPRERRALSQRVSALVARGDEWSSRCWAVAGLVVDAGMIDDEAWFSEAEALGRHAMIARRWMSLGRYDDAVAALASVHDADLVALAESLAAAGRGDEAEAAVRARMQVTGEANRAAMARWLESRVEAKRDAREALDVMLSVLRAQPEASAWEALKRRATDAGLWAEYRRLALDAMEDRAPALAAEVLLAEGDLDGAAEMATRDRPRPAGFVGARMTVADALEAAGRVTDAAEVLEKNAEALAALKARHHYRAACVALARAVRLREAAGEADQAQAKVRAFRAAREGLPALQREIELHFGPTAAAG